MGEFVEQATLARQRERGTSKIRMILTGAALWFMDESSNPTTRIRCQSVASIERISVNSDGINPYQAPDQATAPTKSLVDPATLSKVEAVVKDADQFWLAILICVFCTGIGALIIGPWYLSRLLQWNKLADQNPQLMEPNLPHGSIAQRFQAAKAKLIIGLAVGGVILFGLMSMLSLSLLFGG